MLCKQSRVGTQTTSTLYLICVAMGLLLLGARLSGAQSEMILISGKSQTAKLLSIIDGRLGFASESNVVRSVALTEVVRWGNLVNPTELEQIVLLDGSILVGTMTKITRDTVTVETDLWGELQIPRSKVSNVVWQLPPSPKEQWSIREQLASFSAGKQSLWLSNGDVLPGQVLSGNRQLIRVLRRGEQTEVQRKLVTAWSLQAGDVRALAVGGIELGLSDGSRLMAKQVRLDGPLQMELQCGLSLGTALGVRPVDERLIGYLRPVSGRVVYLSDVKPIGYKHIPFLTVDWPWYADRNVVGGPLSSLSADNVPKYFAKGIGMHSTSRLAFDLDRDYDEFQAEVCIDAIAKESGCVVFRVFGLDNKKWKEFFRSPLQRGGQRPLAIRVPLRGSRKLALVVDYADQGDVMDRANWLGARVVRK